MGTSLGAQIRQARIENDWSQRDLADLLQISHTYLSKIENDHTEYPPGQEMIQELAEILGLNPDELIFLNGQMPRQYSEFVKQHYKEIAVLFCRLHKNPAFAKEILK